jgi:hypothetical protein
MPRSIVRLENPPAGAAGADGVERHAPRARAAARNAKEVLMEASVSGEPGPVESPMLTAAAAAFQEILGGRFTASLL